VQCFPGYSQRGERVDARAILAGGRCARRPNSRSCVARKLGIDGPALYDLMKLFNIQG
jgi:hypothetical protein